MVWTSKRGLENHSAIDISARKLLRPYFGAHGAREIPVPIPNTEVKPSCGDYTATSGKLARCRIIKQSLRIGGSLSFSGIIASCFQARIVQSASVLLLHMEC
jgi:hypothetical protein